MKKLLSIALTALMLLSITLPARAYGLSFRETDFEESLAEDLHELKLFRGISADEFDLDRSPTRVEALVMLIRILGKEQEALEGEWLHPFLDVPNWASQYVGYAYCNGLTQGISQTQYGTGKADAKTYLTFVLRALGYSDGEGRDFAWNDPYEFAASVGILPECVIVSDFLRADIVTISYAALTAPMNGSEELLWEKLADAGLFTAEQFNEVYDFDYLSRAPRREPTYGIDPPRQPDPEIE